MVLKEIVEGAASKAPFETPEVPNVIPTRLHTHEVKVRSQLLNRAKCKYTFEEPTDAGDSDDSTPIFIVPGYGGIKPAYRQLREAIVQHGRPAITLRPIRDTGLPVPSPRDLIHPEKLPGETLCKIMEDMEARYGHEKFDLLAHSMGGFVATEFAKCYPERVRSLTLVASVGIEDHNLATFVPRRILGFLKNEFLPHFATLRQENEAKMALEALYYVARNPIRTLGEGVALSFCNIRDDLRRLETDEGIPVNIMLFESDELIKYSPNIEQARFITGQVITFPDEEANHMWPQLQPGPVGKLAVAATATPRLKAAS